MYHTGGIKTSPFFRQEAGTCFFSLNDGNSKMTLGVVATIRYSKVDPLRSASKATMQNNTRNKQKPAKPQGLPPSSHTATEETAGQRYPPFEQPGANVLYVVDITKTYF